MATPFKPSTPTGRFKLVDVTTKAALPQKKVDTLIGPQVNYEIKLTFTREYYTIKIFNIKLVIT